jgi:hypothetical protein
MNSNTSNYFVELSTINVNEYVEQKGQFSYLSWPYAVSQLRQFDATATWTVLRFDGLPYLVTETGVFVEVAVTVQGITLSQIHPCLDSKNRPIMAPTSFDINTSIQRCLVKAIALHGLGLSIYAGEDLPLVDADDKGATATHKTSTIPTLPSKVTTLPTTQPTRSVESGSSVVSVRSDTITLAQVRYITKLVEETGTELQKVLDYFGVERIEDIAKSEASRVIRSLEQSRDQRRAA